MPDKQHRILLIKNDGDLFNKVNEILTESQITLEYKVALVKPSECLDLLNQKPMPPPSFIICVKGSDNNYKKLFIKIKEIFPETRRMLIVESDDRDEIIESLNNDEIHFCLVDPFNDSNLLEHIEFGFNELEHGNTWEYTKRIVDDQTFKMYKIARNCKEKDEKYQKVIDQKKKEYQILKAELEKPHNNSDSSTSLEKYMASQNTSLSADDYKSGFKKLAGIITKVFKEIAEKNSINFKDENCSDVINKRDKSQTDNKDDINIINDLISYALDHYSTNLEEESLKESEANLEKVEEKNDVTQVEQAEQGYNKLGENDSEHSMTFLDKVLEFEIDYDRVNVQIGIKDKDSDLLNAENIFEYLREMDVNYGLVNEQTLVTWLENRDSVQKLIVAKGTPAELPMDGKVTYHFNTDFIHAGKVKSDGSIDFRERGHIPFVEENTLLAEKVPAKYGKPGIDVSGIQIDVTEPDDPVFIAGDNTFESEGGIKIFAETGGQPHLDAMGIVSVAPVLNINSNVDYETGNISFKGSIVVNGAVKEGFRVEGTNLTAEQIEGAQINLTGDLSVSSGIIDSKIQTQGKIQAKYVNNTTIETFGDMDVTTEVLDSKIDLSGKFSGGKARIIGSEIVAKGGVEAGQIGTVGSKSVRLRVGVDDYIAKLVREIDKKLLETKEDIERIKHDIDDLNKKDEEHFKTVSESAHVQDRTQLEIKGYKQKLAELKDVGNAKEVQALKKGVQELEGKAVDAEKMVENALDQQDIIADQIKIKEKEIEKREEVNIGFVNEIKALRECSEKNDILARVIVNGKVTAGTRVEGQNSSLTVRDDSVRCKIEEIGMGSEGAVSYYDMLLTNL